MKLAVASLCGLVGLVHSFPYIPISPIIPDIPPLPPLPPGPPSPPSPPPGPESAQSHHGHHGHHGHHDTFQNIATGFYSQPPVLNVHDRTGQIKWSFSQSDIHQQLPPKLQHSLNIDANDATEMKWIHGGKAVAAVYGDLVVIIKYAPGTSEDKEITFAAPRRNTVLWNTHTLEPLPDGKLAVATTGQTPGDGILVYDTTGPIVDDPPILQNLTGQRAVHGMLWDDQASILWATGNDHAPNGADGVTSYGTVQGYPYNRETKQLINDPSMIYRMHQAYHQREEWGEDKGWWVGPHDISPIPNERRTIVSCDRDVFVFDVDVRDFVLSGPHVTETYMNGFVPTDDDRAGLNSKHQEESLPRSDIKSVSIAPDGSFLYVQSLWQQFQGNETNLVTNGQRTILEGGNLIYRSRWFHEIPGWPKP